MDKIIETEISNYNPLVSIVIPVFNGSNYVEQAINSALDQTYKNIEIIVINDGSTDDGKTDKICSSYGKKIRYINRKENKGISYTLNEGIRAMEGEYFSWLSHDDVYKKNKIERQIDFLKSVFLKENLIDRRICLCGASETIDSKGKFIRRNISKKTSSIKRDINQLILENVKKYEIGGCTTLIPKEAFLDCGFFNEKLKTVQDAEMWYRMIFKGYCFCYLGESLVQSRVHKSQTGNQLSKKFIEERSELQTWIAQTIIDYQGLQSFIYVKKLGFFQRIRGYKNASNICLNYCKRITKNPFKIVCLKLVYVWANIVFVVRSFLRFIYRKIVVR